MFWQHFLVQYKKAQQHNGGVSFYSGHVKVVIECVSLGFGFFLVVSFSSQSWFQMFTPTVCVGQFMVHVLKDFADNSKLRCRKFAVHSTFI